VKALISGGDTVLGTHKLCARLPFLCNRQISCDYYAATFHDGTDEETAT
jgi:hypothetical protein